MFAGAISGLFAHGDQELLQITTHGFRLYGLSFALCGYCIFSSGFFTALNDGVTSAIISFARTLVLQIVAILVLPALIGVDGIWLSVVVAELFGVFICLICFVVNRKKFQYA